MAAIRIRTKIESENLVLPELKPFLGKVVEIQVSEEEAPGVVDAWTLAEQAVNELAEYDFEALECQQQLDTRQSSNRLT